MREKIFILAGEEKQKVVSDETNTPVDNSEILFPQKRQGGWGNIAGCCVCSEFTLDFVKIVEMIVYYVRNKIYVARTCYPSLFTTAASLGIGVAAILGKENVSDALFGNLSWRWHCSVMSQEDWTKSAIKTNLVVFKMFNVDDFQCGVKAGVLGYRINLMTVVL